VEGVNINDIMKVINGFCNAYNKESYRAIVQIDQFDSDKILLTFPYNIDFVTYCFFVNYLYFPYEMEYSPVIRAWTTISKEDEGITESVADKNVFLFLPEGTIEYDKIYFTTENDLTYKMDFSGFMNPILEVENVSFSYQSRPFAGKNKSLKRNIVC
jgi:hypothetical protein